MIALTQYAGSSTIREVITGVIQRLCNEVDQKELALVYTCLFEEINSCIKDDCLEHLKHLINFFTFTLENSKQNDALGRHLSHPYAFFFLLF
jgi:U3 small nucleolar RNA-associated protein 20